MEMPMLVNLKCIKHKSGYDSSFHNFSLNGAWCLELYILKKYYNFFIYCTSKVRVIYVFMSF